MRQRKGWQEVHRALKRHEFDELLVWKYSRLHRNFFNQVQMLADARASGVEIRSYSEPLDRDSKYGKAMLALIGIFNEMESDTIREQSMLGMRARVDKGMPLVGKKAPYGYRWVTEITVSSLTGAKRTRKVRLEPDPVEAERVRAYWQYMDRPDTSLGQCCAWMNAQGWPSPQGTLWRKTTLRYLLNSPFYWGKATAYRTVLAEVPVADSRGAVEMEKRPRQRPQAEQVPLPEASVPPLVDCDLAERVHSNLHARRTARGESVRLVDREQYLLTGGLARCGICGGVLSPRRRQGRAPYYMCHSGVAHPKGDPRRHYLSIRADDVDRFMALILFETLVDSEKAEAAIAHLKESHKEVTAEQATAEHALHEAENKLATLKKLANHLSEEEMADFAEQYRQARHEVAYWQGQLDALAVADQTAEHLTATFLRAVTEAREQYASQKFWGESPAPWSERALNYNKPWRLTPVERENARVILIGLGAWLEVEELTTENDVPTPPFISPRLHLHLPLGVSRSAEAPRDVREWVENVQLRSGFCPVAVSASHANSTPTMSCCA